MNQDRKNSHPPPTNILEERKRVPPQKDKTVTPKPDINMVGKRVTGVVEGTFEAGYLINVKVNDSDINLRGLVFIPSKVTPITPENDVAPFAKMYHREAKEDMMEKDEDVEAAALLIGFYENPRP